MMVSARGRYALRIMIDLAEHDPEKYIPLKDIATRQEISLKYLEIIVGVLVKAGFVIGLRGKGGGYRLARHPREYSVGSVLKLTEKSLAPVSCVDCGDIQSCPRVDICKTRPMWEKLDRLVDGYLESITISDLIQQ